ncbi:uncharacterized protein LAESUDRAFT_673473 [Laetiporus sulphureus 93-53]|uniref:Uncharacterized protein n=1 Tax=Laetiporus sulphureus 93-53 TaxID=1314785 RepID=A0A165G5L0_9APHY|nr:uncharacterized protein LAESUDRAFT_673473 [Laetiporus sulphureus 93-53]KZT09859.1 hypothetical protein LAESUDRAFT_673473 [Laetiporus sulphureus 93-53]
MSAPPDPFASPSSSPSLSPTRSRRLSARRGSMTAADPWGTHTSINDDPNRATSSRLTIVRVPPPAEEDASQKKHRRHGSNTSIGSTPSGRGEGQRVSFAFTSFSQPSPNATPHANSPTSSPRIRPQSPTLGHRYSGSFLNLSKLSPEQLLDIAHQSCNPRPSVGSGGSPVPPSPVSFTPLPDNIILPFIDRPSEVTQLITIPPNSRLFALLAQTFPAEARTPTGKESADSLLSRDPKQWTFAELEYWMKNVDRDVADDVLWVGKARTCIMAKSELIWERIKGALGVPPELDVDEEIPSMNEPGYLSTPLTPESERYPAVFEPPSPLLAVNPALSPSPERQDIVIEPVVATNANVTRPPPSSTLDVSASHELHDVREEDEEEAEGGSSSDIGHNEQREIQGLRIVTSPISLRSQNYGPSPSGSPAFVPLGSPASPSPMTVPRSMRGVSQDGDTPYDALQERGPGHPLFPSSFAQLSIQPTLRNNIHSRAQSMWNPPAPAFSNPNVIRMGVQRAASSSGRPFRPDWAQGYDPARHEYAVASSADSVSAMD